MRVSSDNKKQKSIIELSAGILFSGMLIFTTFSVFAQGGQGAGSTVHMAAVSSCLPNNPHCRDTDKKELFDSQKCAYLDKIAALPPDSPAGPTGAKIGGWAWNANIGWIAQHKVEKSPCGVVKRPDGHIVGFSYVDAPRYRGWICWGESCTGDDVKDIAGRVLENPVGSAIANPLVNPANNTNNFVPTVFSEVCDPNNSTEPNKIQAIIDESWIDPSDHSRGKKNTISGCAMFFSPVFGGKRIIHLNGKILSKESVSGTNDYQLSYTQDDKEFSGWAWNGTFGWIGFSGKTFDVAPSNPPCRKGTIACKKTGSPGNSLDDFVCRDSCDSLPGESQTYTQTSCSDGSGGVGVGLVPLAVSGVNIRWCRSTLSCDKNSTDAGTHIRCVDSADPDRKLGFTTGRTCEPNCRYSVDTASKSVWETKYVGAIVRIVGGRAFTKAHLSQSAVGIADKSGNDIRVKGADGTDVPIKVLEGSTLVNKNNPFTAGKIPSPTAGQPDIKVFNTYRDTTPGTGGGSTNPRIPFGPTRVVKNNLGTLDIRSLTPDPGAAMYGTSVSHGRAFFPLRAPSGSLDSIESQLHTYLGKTDGNGEVFYYKGDVTIGNELSLLPPPGGATPSSWYPQRWVIANADVGKSGAKTVVIQGNLSINTPIVYQTSNFGVKKLKQLASVAFIVIKNDPANPDMAPASGPDTHSGTITLDNCIPPNGQPGYDYYTEVDGVYFAEGFIVSGHGKGSVCGPKFKEAVVKIIERANDLRVDPSTVLAKPIAIVGSTECISPTVKSTQVSNCPQAITNLDAVTVAEDTVNCVPS